MRRTVQRCLLASVVLFASGARAQSNPLDQLQTRAEASGYEQTSRYQDVVAFLEGVARASEKIHLTHFGYSVEGRPLPLVVAGHLADATPGAVRRSGKTRVLVQANIHAGEVCGKEAALGLLRELAQGEHAAWLDSLVLLVAPIYNADGNERIRLYHRPRQHGPLGGMGQRANAQGYDLNRDHMKLDSPEARALVRLLNRYDPHVVVDLHTTNGTFHAYHLTYALPLNPNTDAGIVSFLREKWLPEVAQAVRQKHGWEFYYYGNLPWRGMPRERGWYTFDHRPRFNNNYVGLRNRFAILSEAYAYLTFEERIWATRVFVEEILDFARVHATVIRNLTAAADRRSVVGQELAVRAEHARSATEVEILLGEVEEERNPYTGKTMLRRKDVRLPERMPEFGTFRPTERVRAPRAYLVPAALGGVVELLQAHGVRLRALERATEMQVERFHIDSTRVAERTYQGHHAQTLFGHYQRIRETVPAGTWEVPLEQPLGRLLFYLLEPRSDDGLVAWGLLQEALKEAASYPILREF